MEEGNICNFNHLDGDTRLPPRKRLLAGLKKQNGEYGSPSSSPPLSSIPTSLSTRLNDYMNSNSKSSEFLSDEVVDASRSAAQAAAKAAAAAKARAAEKAAIAAKAIAVAKRALEIAASISDKANRRERLSRKNKLKKHVPVELLYKKRRIGEKAETDEDLARKLHRAINSSPRISKSSVATELKIHNYYKHNKKHLNFNKSWIPDGDEGNSNYVRDRVAEVGDVESGNSVEESVNMDKIKMDDLGCTKSDSTKRISVSAATDAEMNLLKEKNWERVTEKMGRKRGRIRQKKLSLSLCASRDREYPKEEIKFKGAASLEEPTGRCAAENIPVFAARCRSTEDSMVASGIEVDQ
ncbi:hypothetical protein MKW94_001481 [Papaver nudicaule]|uniref:Uncharacterized protein n=1 Tax=Papaver nudicaule TaxID=74823 RepID=A0AA41VRK2_PAPNU|nr:hypothetical protein [Papaver nudicaule]